MAIQQGLELLFGKFNPGQIGSLVLDAMIREEQHYKNNVTSFPIESGGKVSDHVIQEPEELTIVGFVTNTPVKYLAGIRMLREETTSLSKSPRSNVINAYFALLQMAGYKFPDKVFDRKYLKINTWEMSSSVLDNPFALVDIISGLRVYTNMAMTSLEIPRDAETGDTIDFTAMFKKVKFVDVKKTKRDPSTKKGKAKQKSTANKNKTGAAGANEAPTPKKLVSFVKAALK